MLNELTFFAEQLEGILDHKNSDDLAIVQKGLLLFRQELVYKKTIDPNFITATVQDVIPVQVNLDLLFILNSTCSCEKELFCRHKTAVFFSAYSAVGSVSDWVKNWKDQIPKNVQQQNSIQLQRAKDILKTVKVLEKSYPDWKHFVETSFGEYIESNLHLPYYAMEQKWSGFAKKIESNTPFEREWRALYNFVTSLTALLCILKLLQENTNKPALIRFFHSLAGDLAEDMHPNVQQLSRQARPFAFDSFFDGIKEDSILLLDGIDALEFEKTDLYRTIWTNLLMNSNWRQEELKRLQQKSQSEELSKVERNSYVVATIHLLLLNNRDGEILPLLQKLDAAACPYLFYWVTRLSDLESDYRATVFVEFLITNVQEFLTQLTSYYERSDFVRTFSSPLGIYCQKSKRNDLLEKFYRETLPYSYWNYANYLFLQGHYKKWIEMHIATETSLDLISKELLKEVIAADPALVLPLYHHAVQKTVAMKNRTAYKQAVRYLKKMRTIYKKGKREAAFEEYIKDLSESTKRMRAFQEELQRGKLIHA